jgi:tetratricopeptide (TPR) repeat protein
MRCCLLRLATLVVLVAFLTGCFPRNQPIRPRLEYTPQKKDFRDLPAPFPALLPHEQNTDWGREYRLGIGFARDFDLYRAITSFKRALLLLPRRENERRLELYYYITLSYFLGARYSEVVDTVEQSPLLNVTDAFPAYRDLLLMLHESYIQLGECEKATGVDAILNDDDIRLSSSIRQGCDLDLPGYQRCKKSVCKAQTLSAIIPGAGFWYVGQKHSAITAFVLNTLFIAAAVQFFHRGYWALGAVTTSLEAGWYFGAIYGSGEAAHYYNERLYEHLADPYLDKKRLYPTLMLRWTF